MGFLIGLLTLLLVLDCVILIFLILLQLPKKEAGAGLAFGGAASDALFGAGSGTVLTKITKYAATGFFLVAMVLAVCQSRYYHGSSNFLNSLQSATPPSGPLGGAAATAPTRTTAPATAETPAATPVTPATAPVTTPAPATTPAPSNAVPK